MGGGLEVLDKDSEKLLKISNDLNNIECCVDFSDESNFDLFDGEKLLRILQKDILRYAKLNGLQIKIIEPGGKGSGMWSSLWEIIQQFWLNKDFIFLLVDSFNLLNQKIKNLLSFKVERFKPKIDLMLWISTEEKFNAGRQLKFEKIYASTKLASLLYVGNAMCKFIENEHSYLKVNLSIRMDLNRLSYSINFYIPFKKMEEFNLNRILNIVHNLKIKTGLDSRYSFCKLNLIKREDFKTKNEGGSWVRGSKSKKYFLLISPKLIFE